MLTSSVKIQQTSWCKFQVPSTDLQNLVTGPPAYSSLHAGIAPPHAPSKYIVIDHVERIADTDLLAVLLKAKEITGRMPYALLSVAARLASALQMMILQGPTLG